MVSWWGDSAAALRWVEGLASVGMAVASAEALVKPETMRDEGLCSWRTHQLANRIFVSEGFARTAGWVLEYPRVMGLMAARLIAALVLIAPWGAEPVRAVLCGLMVVASLLLAVRSTYGRDGADQMLFLVFLTLAIVHAVGTDEGRAVGLWFLTGQLCLAYVTAGIAKLVSPVWRGGQALTGIFGTSIYGHGTMRRWMMRSPLMARLGCWSTIGFECAFPLVLVGLGPLTWALIAAGVGFHLAAAVFMRLNTFWWAFLSAYPALWFCLGQAGVAPR